MPPIMEKASLLLVDDHPLVASGIADLLRNRGHLVALARNLSEARAALDAATYRLLLLDINLGQDNGLTLLEDAASRHVPRTVLLSGIAEQEWILRGFELGAFAFIPKSIEPTELVTALDAVDGLAFLPGSGWIWDTARHAAVDAYTFFPRETILTPKEREVFMHLREGKLDKQIADDLGLSIHTVRVHIRAIKRKRGHNRRFEQQY
jgi:DNA-binding NarL/FixJ family response regulator